MPDTLAVSHGAIWWRGDQFVLLEVHPTEDGWTAHLRNERGGLAVAIDGVTKTMLDAHIAQPEGQP